MAVSGNYAYLANWTGLQVIDISDLANPVRVGGNSYISFANSVTVANGKLFFAAGEQGLIMLNQYQPVRFESLLRDESGAFRLMVSGPPGVPGRVERSSDLSEWTDWLPFDFQETPMEFSDPDAASQPATFYRLVVP